MVAEHGMVWFSALPYSTDQGNSRTSSVSPPLVDTPVSQGEELGGDDLVHIHNVETYVMLKCRRQN